MGRRALRTLFTLSAKQTSSLCVTPGAYFTLHCEAISNVFTSERSINSSVAATMPVSSKTSLTAASACVSPSSSEPVTDCQYPPKLATRLSNRYWRGAIRKDHDLDRARLFVTHILIL